MNAETPNSSFTTDTDYREGLVHNIIVLHREVELSRRGFCYKAVHCMLGTCPFLQLRNKYTSCLADVGTSKESSWALIRSRKPHVAFALSRYYTREEAENAMRYVNGTRLDDRIIRTDWDTGFKEGRQYGRGKSGGQVRDEYRSDFDEGRGGYGKIVQTKIRPRDPL